MNRLLPLPLLLLLAAPTYAQPSYDSVQDFLAAANADPALKSQGGQVKIKRSIVMSGRVYTGGELPSRDRFIGHLQGDAKDWTDPYKSFYVADQVGTSTRRLRIRFTTERWRDAHDDVLVYDTRHPHVRRGYVLELEGFVRYDAVRRRWTLYPKIQSHDVTAGLKIKGTVGDAIRPSLYDLHYSNTAPKVGDRIRIAGYHFTDATRATVDGEELRTVSASSDGRELVVEITSNAPHGVGTLRIRGGEGEHPIGVSQRPRITSVSSVRAGELVVISGRNLSRVSSSASLSANVSGLGHAAPSVRLGSATLRVVHQEASVIVARVPANVAAGSARLELDNRAGQSRRTVQVQGAASTVPSLSSVEVSAGLIVLTGEAIKLTPNERVEVRLADGTRLDLIGAAPRSAVARLPAGLASGRARIVVQGRGQSDLVAFQAGTSSGISGALSSN